MKLTKARCSGDDDDDDDGDDPQVNGSGVSARRQGAFRRTTCARPAMGPATPG